MRFVSTRDLRNRPGHIRRLSKKDDLVLTASGRPIAIIVGIQESDLEDTARAIHQAMAQRALSRMRREARERKLDRLPPAAIDSEIRAVRAKRKSA